MVRRLTMQEENREEEKNDTYILHSLYQYCLGLCVVSAFSSPNTRVHLLLCAQFFKERGWYTCTSARVKLSPQRDRGRGDHGTEMKDDEWFIKEERMWWQLWQVKVSRRDPAFLHINRNTSESRMATVTFPPDIKLDYTSVFQVMKSVGVDPSALLECWDTRGCQHMANF